MSKYNGGPAFPSGVKVIRRDGYGYGEQTVEENEPGMTLRDYFAAKAMQGFMSSAAWTDTGFTGEAAAAYRAADAMLEARKQ